MKNHSCLCVFLYIMCPSPWWPSIGLALVPGRPKLDRWLQVQLCKCWMEQTNRFPWLAVYTLLNTALYEVNSSLQEYTSDWFLTCCHQYLQVLFCKTVFHFPVPSLFCYRALFCPRCPVLHLPLLNFMKILSDQFCILLRSFWKADLHSSISDYTPKLVLLSRDAVHLVCKYFWGCLCVYVWLLASTKYVLAPLI